MDLNGNLENELRSPRMDHYSEGNTTHLAEPSLILYSKRSGVPPWYITALHGRAHKGTEWIELWDKVKGYRPAEGNQAAITFLTEAATLFPDKKFATTKLPVQAIQGGLVVNGVGMNVDLQKDEIELLSKVKSVYVPAV
jgi:LPS export ABC transporter protein LptC